MHPLRFYPVLQRYIWGGRRLADVLHKPIGDQTCAECWEIVDHSSAQSVVACGDLAGQSLSELVHNHGIELLGAEIAKQIASEELPGKLRNRFPLLLKFLDAHADLSIQVHPGDAYAMTLEPPDLGKTEAWYVIEADPGAKIFAGLKPGITREKFVSAVKHGFTEQTMHCFEPQAGDCVFIQAGTLHALGAGLLIAEIQQCSNTTFRIFDWDRVDQDGKPRPLHVQQGLEVIDFERGPIDPVSLAPVNSPCQLLIHCDHFSMRRWKLTDRDETVSIGGDDRFRIVAVTDGRVVVESDPCDEALMKGGSVLIPASLGATAVSANEPSEFLEIFIPQNGSTADAHRSSR